MCVYIYVHVHVYIYNVYVQYLTKITYASRVTRAICTACYRQDQFAYTMCIHKYMYVHVQYVLRTWIHACDIPTDVQTLTMWQYQLNCPCIYVHVHIHVCTCTYTLYMYVHLHYVRWYWMADQNHAIWLLQYNDIAMYIQYLTLLIGIMGATL